MSQPIAEPLSPDRWARQVLEISPGVSPVEARKELCRRVEEGEFQPGPATREAIEIIVHGTGHWATAAALPNWGASLEAQRQEEIQEFVRQYFTLPPAERRERWQALKSRTVDYPRLQTRLTMLESGLSTPGEPPVNATSQVQAMIRGLMAVYLAPPAQRAQARRNLELPSVVNYTRLAARQIQRSYPQWARLEPEVLTHLAGDKSAARIERVAERAAPAAAESSGSRVPITVIVFLVVGFLRFLASSNRSSQYDPAPQVKYPSQYQISPQDWATNKAAQEKYLERIQKQLLTGSDSFDEMRRRAQVRSTATSPSDAPAIAEIPDEPLSDLESMRQETLELLRERIKAKQENRNPFGIPERPEKKR